MLRAHTLADERVRNRKRRQILAWYGNADFLTDREIATRSGRNKTYVGARYLSKKPTPKWEETE